MTQKINKKIHQKNLPTKASQPRQEGGLGGWDNVRTLAGFLCDGVPNWNWNIFVNYLNVISALCSKQ